MHRRRFLLTSLAGALAALLAVGCGREVETREASGTRQSPSRSIREARGDVTDVDGRRVQVRYKEEPFSALTTNFEQWPTYPTRTRGDFPCPRGR
jgi:hypothetical protein